MMRALLLLGLLLCAWNPVDAQPEFRAANGPREWSFPRDHAAHPEFSTEWWYFTGSLFDTEGFHYGYELTFFRVGLRPDAVESNSPWRASNLMLAHFAVTEVTWERFHLRERLQRAAGGMAGADTTRMRVWIDDWVAEQSEDGSFRLRALEGDLGIDLTLRTNRAPVLHGDDGFSVKTTDRTQASYYYSMPRLITEGSLTAQGHTRPVSGMTWMDQEFFTGRTPREGLGWDWFSARLADGRDLMLYRVRVGDEVDQPFGTIVEADGRSRSLDTSGAIFTPSAPWTSEYTGATYPTAWRIQLPAEDADFTVRALLPEQEVHAEQTVGFAYWEGLSRYEGRLGDAPMTGEGYVELTGYEPEATSRR